MAGTAHAAAFAVVAAVVWGRRSVVATAVPDDDVVLGRARVARVSRLEGPFVRPTSRHQEVALGLKVEARGGPAWVSVAAVDTLAVLAAVTTADPFWRVVIAVYLSTGVAGNTLTFGDVAAVPVCSTVGEKAVPFSGSEATVFAARVAKQTAARAVEAYAVGATAARRRRTVARATSAVGNS